MIPQGLIVVLMGVTGSGKTTIGRALAQQQDWQFAEGDDYHSEANRAKMRAAIPLTDEDRAPWLTALHEVLVGWHRSATCGVMACSALREAYRERLAQDIPPAKLRFVLLQVPEPVLAERLAARQRHYMNPALLESQIATFEEPSHALRVSGIDPPAAIVAEILHALNEGLQP